MQIPPICKQKLDLLWRLQIYNLNGGLYVRTNTQPVWMEVSLKLVWTKLVYSFTFSLY